MRRWTYSWASSDGLRHEGEILAEDKDSAYAELRARGIRAIRVTERIVPVMRRGIRGLRKRDVVALLLAVMFCVFVTIILSVGWSRKHNPAQIVQLSPDGTASTQLIRISDPTVVVELRRLEDEKRKAESAYREILIERVRKGTLSSEEANAIFRAMKFPEIRP